MSHISDSSILSQAADKAIFTVVTSSNYVQSPDDSPRDSLGRAILNNSRFLSDSSNNSSNDNRSLDTRGIILLILSLIAIFGIWRYLCYRRDLCDEDNDRIRREATMREMANRPVVQLSEHQLEQHQCRNLNDPNILSSAEFDEMLLHIVYSQGTSFDLRRYNGKKSDCSDNVAPTDSTGSVEAVNDPKYDLDPESLIVTKKLENCRSDACSICLDEFRNNDNLTMIPQCLHKFHTRCIREWLLNTKSTYCPLCKAIIKNEVWQI